MWVRGENSYTLFVSYTRRDLGWLRRPCLWTLSGFRAEQGDSNHGSAKLHAAKEGERRSKAERERCPEEKASESEPGKEHEDVEPHGLPPALSAKGRHNACKQGLCHVIAQ